MVFTSSAWSKPSAAETEETDRRASGSVIVYLLPCQSWTRRVPITRLFTSWRRVSCPTFHANKLKHRPRDGPKASRGRYRGNMNSPIGADPPASWHPPRQDGKSLDAALPQPFAGLGSRYLKANDVLCLVEEVPWGPVLVKNTLAAVFPLIWVIVSGIKKPATQ
jgi:hypothetical protein